MALTFYLTTWSITLFAFQRRIDHLTHGMFETATCSTEQNPSRQADSRPGYKIPYVVWNTKVHYHTHKNVPPDYPEPSPEPHTQLL
jgi:hypothetical protein